MQYFKALLVGAFAAVAVAQQQMGTIQINAQTIPSVIAVGSTVPVGYSGVDLSVPVTITLRKGPGNNLATLGDLTTTATGGTFNWPVDTSLVNGQDYALTITQGPSQVNFIGPFAISGSSASASASASSASVSASISSSAAASASSVVSSSAAALVSSIIQSYNASIASANSTVAVITNATTTAPAFVGNTGVAATGTGALTSAGNTTLSLATLTSLSTTGSATSTSGSTPVSSGSTGAQTSAPASSASGFTNPIGFVLSALAAVLYLY